MNKDIETITKNYELALASSKTSEQLQEVKVEYLGKKGHITLLSSKMKELTNEEKREFGKLLNELKVSFNELFENKFNEISLIEKEKKEQKEQIDISLPGTNITTGNLHPLTKMMDEIEEIFISMGYDVVTGPEIESDYYNFERLNLPKDHPARDMQDSLYITQEYLLRTQTSPSQAREMDKNVEKTPIRMIAPGKTYRKDNDDATHSHQFTQIEGLVIDKDISIADLKGTLEVLMKKLFGSDLELRFRPSFFPFTEPSLEVDITCFKCKGSGCPLCKNSGWIEVLGSGMVHPDVLRMGGYDPEVYSGFAFGIGPERFAMFKYGITDIRQFYLNDIRFLKTFDRVEKGEL